jgi:hypothetical protein
MPTKKWQKRFSSGRLNPEAKQRSGRSPQSDVCEFMRAFLKESFFIKCGTSFSRCQYECYSPQILVMGQVEANCEAARSDI